jgi:hypothetical protein
MYFNVLAYSVEILHMRIDTDTKKDELKRRLIAVLNVAL